MPHVWASVAVFPVGRAPKRNIHIDVGPARPQQIFSRTYTIGKGGKAAYVIICRYDGYASAPSEKPWNGIDTFRFAAAVWHTVPLLIRSINSTPTVDNNTQDLATLYIQASTNTYTNNTYVRSRHAATNLQVHGPPDLPDFTDFGPHEPRPDLPGPPFGANFINVPCIPCGTGKGHAAIDMQANERRHPVRKQLKKESVRVNEGDQGEKQVYNFFFFFFLHSCVLYCIVE